MKELVEHYMRMYDKAYKQIGDVREQYNIT